MDHEEAARCWEGNAEAWTKLARAGYDVYRDGFNTPAFFELLPDVAGLSGLDVGCGEGHNTRLLARRGARVTAVDVSETFVRYAREAEAAEPQGIDYRIASALALPFEAGSFDFVASFMCFMDVPETDRVLAEAFRVLKPGGFLQFSICHPCYDTPHRRLLRDADGRAYAVELGDYFRNRTGDVVEWLFSSAPPEAAAGLPKFRTPFYTHTLSQWLNLLIDAGFVLERLAEPRPDDEAVRVRPAVQDAQVVAYFLHVRARKPG